MQVFNARDDVKPVTEFRANTATLIEQVRRTKRALVLTQRGSSAPVVLDVDVYQDLMEELALLRDIKSTEQQLANGEGVAHEEARQQVLAALSE